MNNVQDHTAGILFGIGFMFLLWLSSSGRLAAIKTLWAQPSSTTAVSSGSLLPTNPYSNNQGVSPSLQPRGGTGEMSGVPAGGLPAFPTLGGLH